MSEPPGAPSALGIEAVEWFARDDESLTVRVTGRWRRRRPALSGQPLLVIEAGDRRHRFPAMPEPPGLTGAAPGTWQLSFTVPALLAPPALERAWLQMGAVVVPIPVAVLAEEPDVADSAAGAEADALDHRAEDVANPQLLAERRLRSSELALQATRQRATQAEQRVADLAARVEELQRELEALRAEPARLQALLLQRDAARRAAEQHSYAEQAMRVELQEQLARLEAEGSDTDAVLEELALARERVRELETEIERLSRQVDEAEQIAAAATVARERTQTALEDRIAAQREPALQIPGLALRIGREAALLVVVTTNPARSVGRPPVPRAGGRLLGAERRLMSTRGRVGAGALSIDAATLEALRRQLAARAAGEAKLRGQLAGATQAQSVVAPPAAGLTETLVALRAELLELRTLAEAERQRRRQAETRAAELAQQVSDYAGRSAVAYEAIEGLRAELEHLRPALAAAARAPSDPEPAPDAAAPERALDAAAPEPALDAAAPEPAPAPEPLPAAAAPGGSLDPARLDAALTRLRESAAAHEAQARATAEHGASRPWRERAFASLADRDPAAAARLLLALVAVQGELRPEPLEYDLVLDGVGALQVSVAEPNHRTAVRLAEIPRPANEVRFALSSDPASLAALVASGSLRRRLGRRRVRITGDRRAASALLDLVRTPISLRELIAAGLRVDRWLALTLVSLMIDVTWTRGERFSIAFQEPQGSAPDVYLHVRDGRRLVVSTATLAEAPAMTVLCTADHVLAVLDGDLSAGPELRGDSAPLALLQRWIQRAQSG